MKKLLRASGVISSAANARSYTVGGKLLLPITGGLVGLFLILAGGFYWLYTENYDRQAKSEIEAATKLYQYTAINYQDTMSGIEGLLLSDSRAPQLIHDRDKDALLALYKDAFINMRNACGLTYLLFADDAHRVITRIHAPDDVGDVIRRKSFDLAKKNNTLVTTLDAGSDGRLSLRVVAPVSWQGKHVGFIEAGTEVERVLVSAARPEQVEIVLAMDKHYTSEERIRLDSVDTPDRAFWVDPGGRYFLYTTFSGLDATFGHAMLQSHAESGVMDKGGVFSLKIDGMHYTVSAVPLVDSMDDRLGNLFVFYNKTPLRNELLFALLVLCAAILVVVTASRFFIGRKLRDTDADIVDMRTIIEEGEQIFESIFAKSDTGFILQLEGANSSLKANVAALDVFSVTQAGDIDLSRLVPLPADSLVQQAWQTPLLTIGGTETSRYFEKMRFLAGYSEKLECIALREVTAGVLLQAESKAHIVFLQTVINQMPGWVCIKDSSLRLTQTNSAFTQVFGRGEELKGTVRHSEWLGESMDMLLEADRTALRSEGPVVFELRVPGGSEEREERIYAVSKQRFTGRDGQIHILSTGNDITERARMLEEIVSLHGKAEASSQAKTLFLARMSHELRTPINAISGMSYLALKLGPEEQLRERITEIQKSSKHLLMIITDILDFSEMETGDAKLEAKPFVLAEELDAVTQRTLLLLRQKTVQFTVETSGPCGCFVADAARIRQTLLILCNNAAKFTENGSIRLLCAVMEKDDETYEAHFSVADTGPGIAEEHLEHLFDSFHQVDGGMTRRFGGVGLGLALAGQAVALMGGQLQVESSLGEGSRFLFSIPLERCPDEEAPASSLESTSAPDHAQAAAGSAEELEQFQGSVLVVEDIIVNQIILVELLEQTGLQVQTVDDGQQAVKIVQEQSFDLVLMDLQMPVMNGLEATRQIREFAFGKADMLPIIAVTANAQDSDSKACAKAGMNDFLSKPIDVALLYAKLRQWLPGNGERKHPSNLTA